MRKLIMLFLVIFSSGCSVAYEMKLEEEKERQRTNNVSDYHVRLNVVEFDGCQYVHGIEWFAHKGNCNNPIHMYNKVEK